MLAAFMGTPSEADVNLGYEETRSFSTSSFWRSGIEVKDASGTIQAHFFDSRPVFLNEPVEKLYPNEQDTVGPDHFEFWGFYLNKGSTLTLIWSATAELELWIVEGNSDFEDWKNGEDKGTSYLPGFGAEVGFEARSSNDYYFIFYNLAFSTSSTVTLSFDIDFRVHDISNSKRSITGSFSESDIDEEYVVLYNPSPDTDVTFDFIQHPRYSFGTILLVEVVIVVLIVFLINRVRKNRKKKSPKPGQTALQYQNQFYDPSGASKTPPPAQNQYNQRPQAKFCVACGSGVLPNSTFCTECGTPVKR